MHYNGWGDYPNLEGFTTKKIHAHFEGAFVPQNLKREAVVAGVGAYVDCMCTIEEKTRTLLLARLAQVRPLYVIEKEGLNMSLRCWRFAGLLA